mgnify:FL=1
MTYELINYYDSPNTIVSIKHTDSNGIVTMIPLDDGNRHYQQYIQDIKNGMSNVTCTDCGDGIPNDSMWQCLDNAEELLVNKYGSDQDKLTALREDRYVRAMTAKFPYEKKIDAFKIIDATSQEIKDKNRHLPMRR